MKFKLIIFAIVLVLAAIRIYDIEGKNLWFDEIYSWKISQGDIVQIVSETSGDIHPPLYYIMLKFWNSIFSDSIFSMRMLSVFFSILSIFFILKISKLFLKDNLQIYFVLLLYAFSPLNIFYSQEVRMLNLNLFLCLGSVYFFLQFIQSGKFRHGASYLIFTILGLYTHYFAFLIFFTEAIVIIIFYLNKIINIKLLKEYSVYFILINFLYIPWYPVFISQTRKGQPWRTQQSVTEAGTNVLTYFKEIFLSTYFTFENQGVYYFANFIGIFILVFIIFSFAKILNSGTFFRNKINSIIYFFVIPLITALVISLNNSIVLSRYLSIIIPYFFIMLVYFSFKVYKKITAILICMFLIFTSCFGTYINYNNSFKNNDYRRVISYLEENYNPGDAVIVEPHYMGWSFNYYLSHNSSNITAPKVLGWNLNMQIDSLKRETNIKSVWLIVDYSSLHNNNYDSLTYFMNQIGFNKINSKSFYVIPNKVKVEYYKKPDL